MQREVSYDTHQNTLGLKDNLYYMQRDKIKLWISNYKVLIILKLVPSFIYYIRYPNTLKIYIKLIKNIPSYIIRIKDHLQHQLLCSVKKTLKIRETCENV